MSLNNCFTWISFWVVNLYLQSYIFCLYLHVWIQIQQAPEYRSRSTTLFIMLFKIQTFPCMLCNIYMFPCMMHEIYTFPSMLCKIHILHSILCKIYILHCIIVQILDIPLHVVQNLHISLHAVQNLCIPLLHAVRNLYILLHVVWKSIHSLSCWAQWIFSLACPPAFSAKSMNIFHYIFW